MGDAEKLEVMQVAATIFAAKKSALALAKQGQQRMAAVMQPTDEAILNDSVRLVIQTLKRLELWP